MIFVKVTNLAQTHGCTKEFNPKLMFSFKKLLIF